MDISMDFKYFLRTDSTPFKIVIAIGGVHKMIFHIFSRANLLEELIIKAWLSPVGDGLAHSKKVPVSICVCFV
jgi:hypothetical protein